ncbi:MAG: queuosine precursor transporter [Tannerellaceae bacterium]|nr:queuosine precursor transporter [Tannerellaceae bacterium]
MQKTVSVSFMMLGILFNVCLVAANLLETKIVHVFGITATAGLLVFPISYIINDCTSEVWGYKKARLIIWSGFASNFLVIGFAQLAVWLPAASYWEGEEGFNFVFGMAPRIAVASLIAFLTGSFLNAYIMSKMKIASGGKNFSLRAIVSTVVGESADSLIFFPIAFLGLVPPKELFILIGTQAVLKSLYEIIILPVTIQIVKYIKKVDGNDVYDTNTSFNPLKIKDI